MKRILIALLAVASLLVTAAPAAAASERAAALRRDLGTGAKVAVSRDTGLVRFVGSAARRPFARPAGVSASAPPRDVARAFLAQHGKAFGIANAARDLKVMSSHAASGRSTVRFQQLRSDIPVVGGELVVNLDRAGNVLSATGEAGAEPRATEPQVNSAAARQAAIAAIAKYQQVNAVRLRATSPELWVYDARLLGGPGPQVTRLVWRLEVKGAPGLVVDQLVLVDAATGATILNINQIEQAKNRSVCDANDLKAQVPCTSPVATEADPPGAGDDADVAPAFNFAGETYDYYFTRFGRDSLDDNGLPLKSTIDYCDPAFDADPGPACQFNNAFWTSDQRQMVYGNTFADADDVVGHELTHGVTDFTAHLFYYYQSGAINESLSDVMGEFIDQTNTAGGGDDSGPAKWLIGEDLPIGALRNMANPPDNPNTTTPAEEFNDPDSMTSPNYFGGEADSGGVHTNSGVNNKAAFLMTEPGSKTFGGQTVSGIGIDEAARVYYDAQTRYLTSGSDYADLASALPQACADNVGGDEGITAADCTQVSKAVAAVAMSTDPGPPVEALDAPQPSCPTGQQLSTLFFDNMESFATTGDTNWAPFGDAGIWSPIDDYAHSGDVSLAGGDASSQTDSNVAMTRSVAIPATANSAFLRFDHAYGFDDDDNLSNGDQGGYDGGVVEYSSNGGASYTDLGTLFTVNGYDGPVADFGTPALDSPLAGRQAFIRESHGYISSLANLTSLRGKSLRFRFRIGTDATVGDLGWALDDVRIFACTTPPPPTPPGTTGGGTTSGGGGSSTPALTLKSAKLRSCKISGKGKKLRVKCTLTKARAVRRATVTIKKGKKTVLKKSLKPTSKGVLSIKPKRKLAKGSYKVSIVIRDSAGNKRTLKKTLKVR
jgi:bacillolysin